MHTKMQWTIGMQHHGRYPLCSRPIPCSTISDKQPYKSQWDLKGLKLRVRVVYSPTKVHAKRAVLNLMEEFQVGLHMRNKDKVH